ncbi:MAG: hypothetical protein KGL95_03600 [Patescibacteria group bacterium]|nr:hypothetical protein [Patescibacteria group bacterium]
MGQLSAYKMRTHASSVMLAKSLVKEDEWRPAVTVRYGKLHHFLSRADMYMKRKEVTMYKRVSALVYEWAGRVQKQLDAILLIYRAEVI